MYILAADQILSSKFSFSALGIAHFSVTPAAVLTAQTPRRAQVRHLYGQLDFTKAEQEPMVSRTYQGEIY